MQTNKKLFCKAFLNCGMFIHPDGRKDHLINIKEVNNTAIDSNGWFGYSQMGNVFNKHAIIPDDDDLITALISAAEGVIIKPVIRKQLQAKCLRQRIPKSGTKPELLARLQAYKAQKAGQKTGDVANDGNENDKLASIHIILGTLFTRAAINSENADGGVV
jgi:hypothetical protein